MGGSWSPAHHLKSTQRQQRVKRIVCLKMSHRLYTRNYWIFLGLARTIYIRCIYSIFGREISKDAVIYGVYIRFWPTLDIPVKDYIQSKNVVNTWSWRIWQHPGKRGRTWRYAC
jgi:hypothetical protein